MKNERTSGRVATIAGKVLKSLAERQCKQVYISAKSGTGVVPICTVDELKALAASALSQAPDKK